MSDAETEPFYRLAHPELIQKRGMTSLVKNAFKFESRMWGSDRRTFSTTLIMLFCPIHQCVMIRSDCNGKLSDMEMFFQIPQNEEKRNLELGGHVGFDSLPDQLVSKSVAQGFCFNILCVGMSACHRTLCKVDECALMWSFGAVMWKYFVPLLCPLYVVCSLFKGETGIGKSTLMNTLFNTTFENEEASHYENKVQLRPQTYDLQESNVNLKLTIVHTVGFGDQINKEERYRFLQEFVCAAPY